MKKDFIQGLKIITLGLLLGLGVGMVQAVSWSYPTGTVPSTNTLPPISSGLGDQVKAPYSTSIDPTLFGIHYMRGGLSVDGLSVAGGAQFLKSVVVDGSSSDNNCDDQNANNFLGSLPCTYPTTPTPTSALTVNGNQNIASSLVVSSVTGSSVCVDSNGKLIACPNGACGTANGISVSSAPTANPTTNLCNSGSISPVSGSGPWTWTCTGASGLATKCSTLPKACHGTYYTSKACMNSNTDFSTYSGCASVFPTGTACSKLPISANGSTCGDAQNCSYGCAFGQTVPPTSIDPHDCSSLTELQCTATSIGSTKIFSGCTWGY